MSIITFGYIGGPPGSPQAAPVTFDTTSNLTPWNYAYTQGGRMFSGNGSELSKPWQAQLTRDYWPIPVAGCRREGDIPTNGRRLTAGASIAVSVAEWAALNFAKAAE